MLEVCPYCGNLVDSLNETTGWCNNCTEIGKTQAERFLETNADHIEHYVIQGYSVSQSIDLLRKEIKPTCASCGGFIERASRTAVFCRKRDRCRAASRRYVYLYTGKGLSKAEALAKVLEEIT